MALDIISSVGDVMPDGTPSFNTFDDVLVIQYLLNESGVLTNPLPLDGEPTPELIQAIVDFETAEDTVLQVDGRIDPLDTAWVALNNTNLSDFEGVGDMQERRMIIQRPDREWNFTRGRFKTLIDNGSSLSFHPLRAAWLPQPLKDRLLRILSELLNPAVMPAPTFGVHPCDWCHVHLGLWSGQENVPVSPVALFWKGLAIATNVIVTNLRFQHRHDPPTFAIKLTALMNSPEVQNLMMTYAQLPEAVMVHHTFETPGWRPFMMHTDPRRQWMVNSSGDILKPPYTDHDEMEAADTRGEFICEASIQFSMLIDEFGVIHPVLGIPHDLMIYSGFEFVIAPAPPGPMLHP